MANANDSASRGNQNPCHGFVWPRKRTKSSNGDLLLSGLTDWMWAVTMPKMPYKIATLLYCFDERDRVLLLERAQEPNLGLWSPCGGKLKTETGESPYACACREAFEELRLKISPGDLHLTGLVSEHGYQGQSHWLMFLFEVLKLPQTDRERIWPCFWQHRGGFFSAHCHCNSDGTNDWTLEEGRGSRVEGAGKTTKGLT